jgi:hypothetical protein
MLGVTTWNRRPRPNRSARPDRRPNSILAGRPRPLRFLPRTTRSVGSQSAGAVLVVAFVAFGVVMAVMAMPLTHWTRHRRPYRWGRYWVDRMTCRRVDVRTSGALERGRGRIGVPEVERSNRSAPTTLWCIRHGSQAVRVPQKPSPRAGTFDRTVHKGASAGESDTSHVRETEWERTGPIGRRAPHQALDEWRAAERTVADARRGRRLPRRPSSPPRRHPGPPR